MKKAFVYLLLTIFSLSIAAQKDTAAKSILDKTASLLKTKSLSASFIAESFTGSNLKGKTEGILYMKGNKFHVKTDDAIMWFDGKTQWTYVRQNEEVNINTPSRSELQQINPYAFISMYSSGFNYKKLSDTNLHSQKCYVIRLTAQTKAQQIQELTLYIDKSYRLLKVNIKQGRNSTTVINVSNYSFSKNFSDATFRFNKRDFPQAEVIDLR